MRNISASSIETSYSIGLGKPIGNPTGTRRFRAMHYSNETIRRIGSRALIGQGGTRRSYDESSWLCKWNSSRVDRYGNQSAAQVSEFIIYLGNAYSRGMHRCRILIIQMKARARLRRKYSALPEIG